MLLNEISYLILEEIRNAHIVDDERIDIRLIDELVKTERVNYIKDLADSNKEISDKVFQELNPAVSLQSDGSATILKTTASFPDIVWSKFGPVIDDISNGSLNDIPFTYVNSKHFRYVGNGKFNQAIIFITFEGNNFYIKSKDLGYDLMEDIYVRAALSDPEDDPNFDVETDEFPIDKDGVDYIKEQILRSDIRIMLAMRSDELSDSSGEIKT